MKITLRIGIALLALLTASSCGFHLRNSASLPSSLSPIYIGGPVGNSALGRKLRYHLTNSNTQVTPYSAQAAYQVLLQRESQEQRIISLDRRGLAAEYGLTRSVEFELRDKQNRRVLGPITVEERRTVTNNPDNALTTSQDIGIISADMDQTLAMHIVRRLGAYATHKLPAEQAAKAATDNGDANPTSPNTENNTNNTVPPDNNTPATSPTPN
jgi:LPS-assembly lipoprotein